MMYNSNYFWGMDLIWWFVWIFFMFIIFGMYSPVHRSRLGQDSALDLLQRRFASGEMTKEDYSERKQILENDLKKK